MILSTQDNSFLPVYDSHDVEHGGYVRVVPALLLL